MPKYPYNLAYSYLDIGNKKKSHSMQNPNFTKENKNVWDKIKHHSAAYSITGKRVNQEDRYKYKINTKIKILSKY